MAETWSRGLCKQANEGLTTLKPTEPPRRREPDGVYAVVTDQYLLACRLLWLVTPLSVPSGQQVAGLQKATLF